MSSTCFEPEGSSSGRRLYIQLRHGTLHIHQYKQAVGRRVCSIQYRTHSTTYCLLILMYVQRTVPYRNCIYSRLPEDEPSGSKHVEDIKMKN